MTENNILISKRLDYKDNATLRAQKTSKIINKTLVYLFLTLLALFVIIPFYWMLNISFQSTPQAMESITPALFPSDFAAGNYVRIFTQVVPGSNINFFRFLANTLIVASVTTTIGTLFAILVAFALAKFNFKGRELVFTILLATMMIPSEMFLVTNFVTVARLGWRNDPGLGSYLAMIIPFTVSVFHIFLLRQTFRQVPNELYYAAKIDGCKDMKYLWTVMVPIAKSSIITIVILRVMGAWNAFTWPMLVAHPTTRLVTAWLRGTFLDNVGGMLVPVINLQMAATVAVTVPLLTLFVFARKYIMSGISRSGTKG